MKTLWTRVLPQERGSPLSAARWIRGVGTPGPPGLRDPVNRGWDVERFGARAVAGRARSRRGAAARPTCREVCPTPWCLKVVEFVRAFGSCRTRVGQVPPSRVHSVPVERTPARAPDTERSVRARFESRRGSLSMALALRPSLRRRPSGRAAWRSRPARRESAVADRATTSVSTLPHRRAERRTA